MTPAQKLKLKNQLAAIKKSKPVKKQQVTEEAPAPVKVTPAEVKTAPAAKKKAPPQKPKVQKKRAIKIANIFGTKKSATTKKKK